MVGDIVGRYPMWIWPPQGVQAGPVGETRDWLWWW